MTLPDASPAALKAELSEIVRRLDEIATALKRRGDENDAIILWDARDLVRDAKNSVGLVR